MVVGGCWWLLVVVVVGSWWLSVCVVVRGSVVLCVFLDVVWGCLVLCVLLGVAVVYRCGWC